MIQANDNLDVYPDYSENQVFGKHESDLNDLVNNQRINDPKETLYLMNLIEDHDLSSPEEIMESLEDHHNSTCGQCNQQMSDSFQNRVNKMYNAQTDEFGFTKYSRSTCYRYLYDLFTRRCLKGRSWETEAVAQLSEKMDCFQFLKSKSNIDNKYGVDIIVKSSRTDQVFAGVQVKPKTYRHTSGAGVHYINENKNRKYDHPIYYLFYDNRTEEFENLASVVRQIDALALDIATS